MTQTLQALRNQGAQRLDPVRFHYLEVLARRTQEAPPAVQQILQSRLSDAVADFAERWGAMSGQQAPALQAPPASSATQTRRAAHALAAPASPLAQLTQRLAAHNPTAPALGAGALWPMDEASVPAGLRAEMKSLRRFRDSWSRFAAEDQLEQAMGRAPDNAGPLNSHVLVLRALGLMREISPDYLRRHLAHAEALLWLDQASQFHAVGEAKPARRSRSDK